MSDYTPDDVVKYALTQDGARVKEAIQGVLADKIMKGMEAKKAEVAQSMFNSAVNSEPPVEEPSGETVVAEPEVNTVEAE
jgi:hypothetical protein